MNHLYLRFVIAIAKSRADNKAPILCRITYNQKRKQFSTGLYINPKDWDNKKQQPIAPSGEITLLQKLSLIKQKINKAFLILEVQEESFTVQDIYKTFKGETIKKNYEVLEVYELYCKRISKLINKEIKKVTYDKYVESGNHLKNYLKWKFKSLNFELKDLKSTFIDDYEYYLKTEMNLKQSTINKAIQRFRKVIKFSISEEYLDRDPFILYKPKSVRKTIVFLTREELEIIKNHDFKILRLEKIRDMFVFCCYTGLAFKEMTDLKKKDIFKEFDGELWLHIYRSKSNRSYKVPLLPNALSIIEKYKNEGSEFVLPKVHNQHFNAYLKEIAGILGINKNLTHHIARKTFATTVLLYNDVPLEVVSELLGHSKIQTTQEYYGKIVQQKLSYHMKRISESN